MRGQETSETEATHFGIREKTVYKQKSLVCTRRTIPLFIFVKLRGMCKIRQIAGKFFLRKNLFANSRKRKFSSRKSLIPEEGKSPPLFSIGICVSSFAGRYFPRGKFSKALSGFSEKNFENIFSWVFSSTDSIVDYLRGPNSE